MITATATEFQNNFGRYLQAVENGEEIIVLKRGKEVARLTAPDKNTASITKRLSGICKAEIVDDKQALDEALREKYGL